MKNNYTYGAKCYHNYYYYGYGYAYHRAQNRQAWSKLVGTATSASGQATWWWWYWILSAYNYGPVLLWWPLWAFGVWLFQRVHSCRRLQHENCCSPPCLFVICICLHTFCGSCTINFNIWIIIHAFQCTVVESKYWYEVSQRTMRVRQLLAHAMSDYTRICLSYSSYACEIQWRICTSLCMFICANH